MNNIVYNERRNLRFCLTGSFGIPKVLRWLVYNPESMDDVDFLLGLVII